MDLYCQKCSEPWDFWHVQSDMDDELEDFADDGTKPSVRFKNGEGCPACDWGKKAPKTPNMRAQAMKVTMDLLGDDIDGVAAMMDDFEAMGMLDDEDDDNDDDEG